MKTVCPSPEMAMNVFVFPPVCETPPNALLHKTPPMFKPFAGPGMLEYAKQIFDEKSPPAFLIVKFGSVEASTN